MPVQFRCPECGKSLRAPSAKAGQRGRCKQCGQIFRIPSSSPAPKGLRSDEPDFGSLKWELPPFAGGGQGDAAAADPSTASTDRTSEGFADLPEFQSVTAAAHQPSTTDDDFHRMMMAESKPALFQPDVPPGNRSAGNAPPGDASDKVPESPDHSNLADVLGSLSSTIQTAVDQQQARNQRAIRPKFTVDQIRKAFSKPLGDVRRVPGLRRKQWQSALLVAMVPAGFVAFVVGSTIVLFLLYRGWMHGDSEGVLHPAIGLSFVIGVIVILGCWIPTINLIFAGFNLLFGKGPSYEADTKLTRDSQPVMYEFVDQICEKLGAPKPCRIDLDCQFNASASLRRVVTSRPSRNFFR